jgi:two-component system, response regulator PdtaR
VRVLLADDNRLLLSVIASVLRIGGHKVLVADSGEEALRLTQEQHPEAAIIDFYMPRVSGEDVGRQCRELGIPFVFISAYDDAGTRKIAYDLGARAYLVKPAAREDLLAALVRCAHP